MGTDLKRIALGIEYDGSLWKGWQTQPSRDAVQDVLEAALRKFTGEVIQSVCAGRTDAGVHALEQVVHLDTGVQRELASWVRGLNALMPPSIAVRWACEPPALPDEQFHSRYSATARTYQYLIYNNPVRSPLFARRAGWVFRPLDRERMQEAANCLVGTHDFSAFRAAQCQSRTPVRTIHDATVTRQGDMLVVCLRANAFLHHMVRNIVGSLIYVGNGSQPAEWVGELIAGRNRHPAAPTFSPDGLYLARVEYDPKWQLPQDRRSVALSFLSDH